MFGAYNLMCGVDSNRVIFGNNQADVFVPVRHLVRYLTHACITTAQLYTRYITTNFTTLKYKFLVILTTRNSTYVARVLMKTYYSCDISIY